MKITTLMDNLPSENKALINEHGLSVLIERGGKRILFDCGQGAAGEPDFVYPSIEVLRRRRRASNGNRGAEIARAEREVAEGLDAGAVEIYLQRQQVVVVHQGEMVPRPVVDAGR